MARSPVRRESDEWSDSPLFRRLLARDEFPVRVETGKGRVRVTGRPGEAPSTPPSGHSAASPSGVATVAGASEAASARAAEPHAER